MRYGLPRIWLNSTVFWNSSPRRVLMLDMRPAAHQPCVIHHLPEFLRVLVRVPRELDPLIAHLRHPHDGARGVLIEVLAHRVQLHRNRNLRHLGSLLCSSAPHFGNARATPVRPPTNETGTGPSQSPPISVICAIRGCRRCRSPTLLERRLRRQPPHPQVAEPVHRPLAGMVRPDADPRVLRGRLRCHPHRAVHQLPVDVGGDFVVP